MHKHRHHRRHLRRRHLVHAAIAAAATFGVLPAHAAAPAVDPATVGYTHLSELDFHPSPDNRPPGSVLPVLYPHQHCQFYIAREFEYFNGRVLICG